jgi:hypothetical protein
MQKNEFFEFSNAPLMSCRHCHFPSGKFENELEKLHLLEGYLLNLCSLVELLIPMIPICPLVEHSYVYQNYKRLFKCRGENI